MVHDTVELAIIRIHEHSHQMNIAHVDDYQMTEMIKKLGSDHVYTETLNILSELMEKVQDANREDYGLTEEIVINDYYLVVSYFNTKRFPVVGASFPGGYLSWLNERFEKASRIDGGLAFVHWILLANDDVKTTHLTIIQRDVTAKKIIAWDFFNPSEMQQAFQSDPRNPEVKKQWQIK